MTETPQKFASAYGNCQADALLKILGQSPGFSQRYSKAPLPPCFEVKAEKLEDWAAQQAPQVGLLITQKLRKGWRKKDVFDSDWLATQVPDGTPRFDWSDMYYKAYEPHMAYPLTFPKRAPSHYLNLLHVLAFVNDRPWQDALEFYTNPSIFPRALLVGMHHAAQEGLAAREAGCAIQITPFIREHFQDERLFMSFNHPSRATMRYAANIVISRLGIEEPVPEGGWYTFSDKQGQPLLASMEDMLAKKSRYPMETSFYLQAKSVTAEEYFTRWQAALEEIGKEKLVKELEHQTRDPVMVAPILAAAAQHMGVTAP